MAFAQIVFELKARPGSFRIQGSSLWGHRDWPKSLHQALLHDVLCGLLDPDISEEPFLADNGWPKSYHDKKLVWDPAT